MLIDNWKPITLLNNDCKMFEQIVGKRITSNLDSTMDEKQNGFMQGRSIHNNIRLILDMIEYNQLILDNSFILCIDFYKAFDTIEHDFLFTTMKCFGFGEFFLNAVKMLYNGCNSSVKLTHGTTFSSKEV